MTVARVDSHASRPRARNWLIEPLSSSGVSSGSEIDDGVVQSHPDAFAAVSAGVDAVGQMVDPEAAHSRPRASRSSYGSLTLQEPNEVNHLRVRAIVSGAELGEPGHQGVGIALGEYADGVVTVERRPGRQEHVEEAVMVEPRLGVGVGDRVVQAGRALERCLAIQGGADPLGEQCGRREQVGLLAPGAVA